ncbi:hypothetical protein BDZ94DRAFT_1252694 [Collybia nuda]|uniref:Secreted protein n=1 Tax=Collybia nuda TaxID=64659 RepID=A0A9P5Y9Q4_9AGAR|nr:hypothetical protein BDZ94DRAFT_1252694 [Collybia nuda]
MLRLQVGLWLVPSCMAYLVHHSISAQCPCSVARRGVLGGISDGMLGLGGGLRVASFFCMWSNSGGGRVTKVDVVRFLVGLKS